MNNFNYPFSQNGNNNQNNWQNNGQNWQGYGQNNMQDNGLYGFQRMPMNYQQMQNMMNGVVRYPMSSTYNAGNSPFCNCGNFNGCCCN